MTLDFERGEIVKICGLQSMDAATAAARAGADALGFILAESRRKVAPSLLREVRRHLDDRVDRVPVLVGVTVHGTAADLMGMVEESGMDMIQLSGEESATLLDDLDVPVMKTVHVSSEMTTSDVDRLIEPWLNHPRPAVAVHIDARVTGAYGGTGMRADWSHAARIASRYPTLLAGGLNVGNVIEGIRAVAPCGVDVSSGVEIAGVKDVAMIETFVARSRQGFAAG